MTDDAIKRALRELFGDMDVDVDARYQEHVEKTQDALENDEIRGFVCCALTDDGGDPDFMFSRGTGDGQDDDGMTEVEIE